MWGFFQNRGYYQYTNGYTTKSGFNDGSGSGFASLLLSLPAVKQRQAGIPQMNLRNWGGDAFVEDSWKVTTTTTLNLGVRYEYTSPLYDKNKTTTNLLFRNDVRSVFVGWSYGSVLGLSYLRPSLTVSPLTHNHHQAACTWSVPHSPPVQNLSLRSQYHGPP